MLTEFLSSDIVTTSYAGGHMFFLPFTHARNFRAYFGIFLVKRSVA